MLSIIISSYQKEYFDKLVKNINETIGDNFLFEIIQMWNPNIMGITKAYNLGAEKSQYENLLFIHEDILFHTQNWGEKLTDNLSKSDVGILGIAGSSYVPVAPCSWTVTEKYNFVNIIQNNKEKNNPILTKTTKAPQTPVYAVDGVFMGIKKDVFNQFKFEEKLPGFHGYDLDFSLRVSKKYQNFIIDKILIEHFSKGNLDKNWFDANIRVKQEIGSHFQKNIDKDAERQLFMSFLYKYFEYYPVTWKNIMITLKYLPFQHLTLKNKMQILKKYVNYLRYSSQFNNRINTNN